METRSNVAFVILVFGFLATVCSGITIKNVTVPQSYVLDHNTVGSPKPLVLDCEFETDPRDTGVVLKWFFNKLPIYQWIPGSHPIPLQRFKPHLDVTYQGSTEPKQMYRAISILNPTWNMTGNYSCSLQSFYSSDMQSAQLIVIEPEKQFDFHIDGSSEDEMVMISCSVSGIYPKPRLTVNINGKRIPGHVTDNEATRPSDGLYEVNYRISINSTQMPMPWHSNCVLEIPTTDYVRERAEVYNEVTTTTTTTTTTVQTLTYKDGEPSDEDDDDTNQISRLEAVVHGRTIDENGAATTLISTALLLLSSAFLRYMA